MAVGRDVVEQAQENEITFLAASIAYYAFVSLIPLLLFSFVAASVIGGQELANQIANQASDFLAPAGQSALEDAITAESGRGGATVAGSVVLLWSALKLFRGLDTAFSLVYDAGLDKSIVAQITNALIVFVSILLAVLGMLALGTVLAFLPDIPFGVVTPLIVLVALSVVFLPMYYVLPDVEEITVRQAVPGALLAAFGWTVLHSLFGLYASTAGQYEAYGVIGGILLLLTWLYIGGIVIILGAIFNSVLMNRDNNDTPDEPDESEKAVSSEEPTPETGEGGGDTDRTGTATGTASAAAPDVADLQDELRDLRSDLDGFRADIEDKTVDKEEVESDLKGYVRKRMRRGHATGWGPYLVLLYGTVMTLGAFYFMAGGWAILAMVVLWLSTLGLYVMMVIVGTGLGALGFPGRVRDAIEAWRG